MNDPQAPRQLGLFGPAPDAEPVGPAPVSDELAAIAAKLPRSVHLGTSSWSFPGWEGIVYDREADPSELARDGLAAYARNPVLRAAGLDRTYYAPLPAEEFARYAEQVPPDFRFLVKAHADCVRPFLDAAPGESPQRTNARFLDPAYAAGAVVGPAAEGLGERIGVILFQLPPIAPRHVGPPAAFIDLLYRFLAALPKGPSYAVEIRNPQFLVPRYADALAAAGVAHAYNVHPSMPPIARQLEIVPPRGAAPVVVRWMLGHGFRYDHARDRYTPFNRVVDEDPEARVDIARLCRAAAAASRPSLVIANNKAEGSAPLSLFALARLITV